MERRNSSVVSGIPRHLNRKGISSDIIHIHSCIPRLCCLLGMTPDSVRELYILIIRNLGLLFKNDYHHQ